MLRTQPLSLKLFAGAFMAQAVLNAAHTAVSAESLLSAIESSFGTDDPYAILPFLIAMRLLIAAIIVWFVFFRASRAAKWVAIVIVLGRIVQIRDAWFGLQSGNPNSIAWSAEFLIGIFAVACLLSSEARAWFARRGRTPADDRAIFE